MNFSMIRNILGWILIFEGAFMTVPIITGFAFGEYEVRAFIAGLLVCLAAGGLLILGKPKSKVLYAREGYVIVSLSWIVLSLFGALPVFLSEAVPSFSDALFETVSGFTTTGASVIADTQSLPKCVLIWRCFANWVGGMGVLVFIMAFVPLSGGTNMHIMKAESPGPSVSKLVPKVKTTAMILYSIYFVLTFLEFIVLLFGGLSVFEALSLSFSTAGTGGFGLRNDSLGGYSPFLQIAVMVFMLLFSVSFSSYYFILRGKFKEAFSTEVRVFLLVVAAASVVIALNIRQMFPSNGEAARHAAFTAISVISSTGFTTVDFDIWPELSRTIIVLLMFIGSCAGSTGCGIKISRIIILFKSMSKELGLMIHPKQIKKINMDSHRVEHEVVRSVNVFMVCYLLIFVISVIALSFDDHDLVTTFTAAASAMNNIGPGLGKIGPSGNFAFMSLPAKLVLIFDMLAGRLELFPMLLLFSPATWKK